VQDLRSRRARAKRTDAACSHIDERRRGDPETQARLAGIRQGLSRFGWSEGRNVEIDYCYASASAVEARLLAKDLVDRCTICDRCGGVAARDARYPDRVRRRDRSDWRGLVASLARPGGNLTSTLLNEEGIVGKWLAMLKEIAPQLARVAVLLNPKMDEFASYRQTATCPKSCTAARLNPGPHPHRKLLAGTGELELENGATGDTPCG
jgi:hypothetical protein